MSEEQSYLSFMTQDLDSKKVLSLMVSCMILAITYHAFIFWNVKVDDVMARNEEPIWDVMFELSENSATDSRLIQDGSTELFSNQIDQESHPNMMVGYLIVLIEYEETSGNFNDPCDIVSAETHIICGTCEFCLRGEGHICENTKIIGVEPEGAPSMKSAFQNGAVVQLDHIDNFVDGAAVKRVGDKNFTICKQNLHDMITIHEGSACQAILDLYNKEAIIAEPAGALSVAALDTFKDDIKGKNVVCIISGGNNDITRTAEIKERALLFSKLKHYFIINFPQRAGALREFVVDILGPNDDITHFEYTKKANRENDVAVVGIELKSPEDLEPLIANIKRYNFYGDYLNEKPDLFQFLV